MYSSTRKKSIFKNPNLITGQEQQYYQHRSKIMQYDLQHTGKYVKQKIGNKKSFIKNQFQNKNYSCLTKILQSTFDQFIKNHLENHKLQNQYIKIKKENQNIKEQITLLQAKKGRLENENSRIKSNIIHSRQQLIRRYDNGQIVISAYGSKNGSYKPKKIQQLIQNKDNYDGYTQEQLPIFRKFKDLESKVKQQEQMQPPSIYDINFNTSIVNKQIYKPIKLNLHNKAKYISKKDEKQLQVLQSQVKTMKIQFLKRPISKPEQKYQQFIPNKLMNPKSIQHNIQSTNPQKRSSSLYQINQKIFTSKKVQKKYQQFNNTCNLDMLSFNSIQLQSKYKSTNSKDIWDNKTQQSLQNRLNASEYKHQRKRNKIFTNNLSKKY